MRRRKKLAIAGALVLVGLLLAAVLRRDNPSSSASVAKPAPSNRGSTGEATLPVAIEDDEPSFLFGGGGLGRPPSQTASDKDDFGNPYPLPRLNDRIDEDDDLADDAAGKKFSRSTGTKVSQGERPAIDGDAEAWRPSSRVGIWQQFDSAQRIGASRQWPADDATRDRPANRIGSQREPAGVDADDTDVDDMEAADDQRAGEPSGAVVHRIRDGDTLSGLARRYLGSRDRYREIYDANRDRLKNPDLLPIGVEIRIPMAASTNRGKPSMMPVGQRIPLRDR